MTDIGRPPAPGAGTADSQGASVTSRGYDVNGTADQFTFLSRSVRGDVVIIAKLTSLQNVDPGTIGGLMLRESLDPTSNHVSAFASPTSVVVRSRKSARTGTTETSGGSAAGSLWLKLERRASTVTASRSTDGVNWTSIAPIKISMAQTLLVGLAAASHNSLTSTTAALTSVTVNGVAMVPPAPAPNVPPTVSLNSPAANAIYEAPASVSIGATAADSDGTVAKVEFYNGTTLLGSDTTSPYTFSWNNVPAGSYSLKAVATDNAGASTTSSAVTVTVNANTPPAVSLTSPSSGTSFMAPASTAVTATASDANGGSVVRVDFYVGATLLGSDTTSPYSVSWSNVPAGTYVLTAKATDNGGASTTSAGVSITVNANQAPTVSLTSPTTGSTFTAPATINLTASASDVDGTIQRVDFYNGTTLLGTSTTSPFTFSWQNVAAGSYSLSAMAVDNQGATAVSSWSDVTVGATAILSKAIFTPAVVPDTVDYYVFEVYAAGSDPNAAAPLATQNLGLPAVVNGECTVDVKSTITALAPGSYIATVSSMSAVEGALRSAPFTFTR